MALVNALAKLHNFCIDVKARGHDEWIADSLSSDLQHLMTSDAGFVEFDHVAGLHGETTPIPTQLIDGGNHFADYPQSLRRRIERRFANIVLPRESMLRQVIDSGRDRPDANKQRNQNRTQMQG